MSDEPEDHWAFFRLLEREHEGTCFLNLSLRNPDRQRGLPCRVTVAVTLNTDDCGGMGTTEERQALQAADSAFWDRLALRAGGDQVGFLRIPGTYTTVGYCADRPSASDLQSAADHLGQWQVECSVEDDPDWQFYMHQLCPSPIEEEWLQNANVEHSLSQHGDPIEAPREIMHWAYFPDQAACDEFAGQIQPEGFEIHECGPEAPSDDAPQPAEPRFKVRFAREDLPSADDLTPITYALRTAAQELGGRYDGWETAALGDDGEDEDDDAPSEE